MSSNSGNNRNGGESGQMERRAFLQRAGLGLMLAVGGGLAGCGSGGFRMGAEPFTMDDLRGFSISTVTPNSPRYPDASLYPGETTQFTARVDFHDLPATDVEWSVRGGSVNGTIDANGLYTAPAVAPTSDGVYVQIIGRRKSKSSDNNGFLLRILLRVTVEPESVTVPYGGQVQFTARAEGLPAGASNGFIWSMTDLPYTGTITEGGLYTAPAAPHENNASGTMVFAEIKYGSSNYGYGDAHVKFE